MNRDPVEETSRGYEGNEGLDCGRGKAKRAKVVHERMEGNAHMEYVPVRHNPLMFNNTVGLSTDKFDELFLLVQKEIAKHMDHRERLTEEGGDIKFIRKRSVTDEDIMSIFLTCMRGGDEGGIGILKVVRFGLSSGNVSNYVRHGGYAIIEVLSIKSNASIRSKV